MKRKLFVAALCTLTVSGFAARQVSAPTIDGDISDIDGTVQVVQTVANGFGAGNGDLYRMRISNDSTYAYLGIAAKLDAATGTRGVWILIDSKSGGQNTISTNGIVAASQGAKDLTGTVLETGFAADYIIFMQNGDGGNRQNYFVNVQDLQAGTDTYLGVFNATTNSFTASGSEPVGFLADIDNTATETNPAQAGSATKGIELRIPLSFLGATDSGANTLNVLAGTGDGGNAYWSNQTLPASNSTGNLGGGNSNGSSPNFQTNAPGAFAGDTSAFSGSQTLAMPLPVSVSGFSIE